MKLFDLDKKDTQVRALKENFDVSFDPTRLSKNKTVDMLKKVRNLIKEAKESTEFYSNQNSGSYMKLVFMEQSLAKHYAQLLRTKPRIVVENAEVEKSQVILAAQDMVDSIQKMIEEVNEMLVKELPALVDSIQSEIGVNESTTFNTQASESLTTLNQTLTQSKNTLQSALNAMTGQGGEGFDVSGTGGEEAAVTDIGAAAGPGGEEVMGAEEVTAEVPAAPELPAEEPEAAPVGGVGRAKR